MGDKIFFGGDIVTVNGEARPFRSYEALLVQNGKIAALGEKEQLFAIAPAAEAVNLEGGALMPAFIDPHGHLSAMALRPLQLPLETAKSFAQIKSLLKEYIQKNSLKPGEWINATGYDQNRLEEKSHPPKALLDAACPQNPVVVQHISGHMGAFNSLAERALGISAENGYLEEIAFVEALKAVPMPSVQKILRCFERALHTYASYGITTLQEGMMPRELIAMYNSLLESGLLRQDIIGYIDPDSEKDWRRGFSAHFGKSSKRFKIGGFKAFLDGSPQAKTAWVSEKYLTADTFGVSALGDDKLLEHFKKSAESGLQLLVHCNGDMASEQFLRVCKMAQADFPALKRLRPVIIHAQLITTAQLRRASELGAIPSFFVGHIHRWGDVHLENLGERRAGALSPLNSAFKLGLPFTLHQDAPVTEPNMLKSVWCAAKRASESGKILGKDERISVYAALCAVTANAAYQYFEEEQKGSLAAGKLADMVLLSENPLKTPLDKIPDIKILKTFKEGEAIFTA